MKPTKRTGTIETNREANGRVYFRGKIRLDDGSRVGIEIPETKRYAKTAARNYVAWAQEQEDTHHTLSTAKREGAAKREARVAGAAGETCDAWYERFKKARKSVVGDIDEDAYRWSKWISRARVREGVTTFGALPIREVTADDVEDVRDALTAAVVAYEAAGNMSGDGRLAPKTAQNVWAALTTPMKYASTRKGPRELRVREDKGNPCADIPPPRDGASKKRHWLRPHQWVKFIAWLAPRDRAWAEAYAVGLYLHLRPGELHELRVKDLVLVDREVRISRAWDDRERATKLPKTEMGIRTVTIPDALLPMLTRIARERGPEDLVCPIVAATRENSRGRTDDDLSRAGIYRAFLKAAGVDEPAFFVETATHLMIDFRSLRDSGITWRFLAGDRSEVVQRESGHEHIATTLGYAKEVHDRRGRYGEPFPSLPSELLGPGPSVGPKGVTKRSDAHLGEAGPSVVAHAMTGTLAQTKTSTFSIPGASTTGPRKRRGPVALWGA